MNPNDWFNWPLIANSYNWFVVALVMILIGIAGVFVAGAFKGGSS